MDYKVLYRKYRPTNFDELVGQEYLKKILLNSITNNRISHAYIFAGPRGTGKTSTAKIFAKAINCLAPNNGNPCGKCDTCLMTENSSDIIEIDAASNNGIEEVRQLIENVKIANSELKYKVYIIDEVHMMTNNAFNALLLTLEEPPSNVIFIFATTDIQSVPSTIVSRCQVLSFKPINDADIVKRLDYICKIEKIAINNDAISEIAALATGGLRDALVFLDQLSLICKEITIEDVIKNYGGVSNQQVRDLVNYLENGKISQIIDLINRIRLDGVDYNFFTKKIVEELKRKAIAIKFGKQKVQHLSFDDCLQLSIKIIDCTSKNLLNADVFSLIELCILDYCSAETVEVEEFVDNLIEKEIIESIGEANSKIEIEKTLEKTIIAEEIKKTRINNCFVGADKNLKKEAIKIWEKFIDYLKNNDKKTFGMLMDTEVEAASDKYYVVSSKIESTTKLANGSLKKIERAFANFANFEIRLILLTPEEWILAKDEYKNNVRNNVVYKIIDEVEINISSNDSNKFENSVNDVFDTKKIEIV